MSGCLRHNLDLFEEGLNPFSVGISHEMQEQLLPFAMEEDKQKTVYIMGNCDAGKISSIARALSKTPTVNLILFTDNNETVCDRKLSERDVERIKNVNDIFYQQYLIKPMPIDELNEGLNKLKLNSLKNKKSKYKSYERKFKYHR